MPSIIFCNWCLFLELSKCLFLFKFVGKILYLDKSTFEIYSFLVDLVFSFGNVQCSGTCRALPIVEGTPAVPLVSWTLGDQTKGFRQDGNYVGQLHQEEC